MNPVDTANSAVSIDGDEQAALAHEVLQVRDAGPAESRTHVVGLVFGTQVRRLRRFLPRQRIAAHRHAVHDGVLGAAPTGGKMITSNCALRLLSFATSCVLMYVNGTCATSKACRHQPSVCVVAHVCRARRAGAESDVS